MNQNLHTGSLLKRYLLLVTLLVSSGCYSIVQAQNYTLSGKVLNRKPGSPVGYALVTLPENNLWAITSDNGEFTIRNITSPKVTLTISCLGYVKSEYEVDLNEKSTGFIFNLPEDNLLLEEVVVTAKRNEENISTSYTIDRTTLDHLQMMNIADISSLLPGGTTNSVTNLAVNESPQNIEIRMRGSGEMGNTTFGSAIMVDGVRINSNSYFSGTDKNNLNDYTYSIQGVDVRSLGTSNIESIEVITGIPSVEYGDLTNGMVKINTRKGKTPWIFDVVFKPQIKQYAASKGFDLGSRAGVLNLAYEHSRSIKDPASPYTTYVRNNISLQYSNTFNRNGSHPLRLSAGLSGNIGGYNNENDPDLFNDTYYKRKDNNLRFNTELEWLINKPWLTNLQASVSIHHSNKTDKQNIYKSSSASSFSLHATEEGYYIAKNYNENPEAEIKIIPAGHWYELKIRDDKPLDYTTKLKANWSHRLGEFSNRAMMGIEYSRSINKGKGYYFDDMRYAPSWREYRYDELPAMNNVAFFAEDKLTIPVSLSSLELMGGLRSDITSIAGSAYGTVSSLSPRFNLKFKFKEHQDKYIQDVVLRAGWGKSVKLPSYLVLFPAPKYTDKQSFASTTSSDGSSYVAYYTIPTNTIYNPDLKWQNSIMKELGLEFRIGQIGIALSGYHSKINNPYTAINVYTPITYKLTDQIALNDCLIPAENRVFSVNKQTGVVTVGDKTGTFGDQELTYREKSEYKYSTKYINGSASVRKGLEWVVNFGKIPALNTSIEIDGKYYYYRGVEETLIHRGLNSSVTGSDGTSFKYIGLYVGTEKTANGSANREIINNVTITTHIPAIRLIISAKIEGYLYNYSRNLSEYAGGKRSFVLEDNNGYLPSATETNIYGRDKFVGMYPLYYITREDLNTLIPFEETFLYAKENDPALFNDLARLVVKANTSYYFNPNKISAYVGANLSVTKEIGNFLSISFNAVNFTNSLKKIKRSDNNRESTVHNNNAGNSKFRLPDFYYGLSLRIKL